MSLLKTLVGVAFEAGILTLESAEFVFVGRVMWAFGAMSPILWSGN